MGTGYTLSTRGVSPGSLKKRKNEKMKKIIPVSFLKKKKKLMPY